MVNYREKLIEYIKTLDGIYEEERSSSIVFSSISNYNKRELRLVWIEKTDKEADFWVWVRRDIDTDRQNYPDKIKSLSNYNPHGPTGSKAFKIQGDRDLEIAKEIIRFAYDYL